MVCCHVYACGMHATTLATATSTTWAVNFSWGQRQESERERERGSFHCNNDDALWGRSIREEEEAKVSGKKVKRSSQAGSERHTKRGPLTSIFYTAIPPLMDPLWRDGEKKFTPLSLYDDDDDDYEKSYSYHNGKRRSQFCNELIDLIHEVVWK